MPTDHPPATLIQGAILVNEGTRRVADVLIEDGDIRSVGDVEAPAGARIIDARGLHLLPGIIDGQVHFRDPGLTHKADLHSESRAAVAGGVTSFIDMPNTKPNVLTLDIWRDKYRLAAEKSLANFGFFMGVNAENIDDVLAMDTTQFLAVSDDGLYFTKKGNLLADNVHLLDRLFAECECIIALHSEKEAIIERNEEAHRAQHGDDVPFALHPVIRSHEACLEATHDLIDLARRHGTRLHILHLTTADEAQLFESSTSLHEKRITTEVCVQHLWFSTADYDRLGARIKWNPAIKTREDADGLLEALVEDRIDLVTTDHAPHTLEEKSGTYFEAVSGAPMVQHALNVMLEFEKDGRIGLETIVEKMCHNPARLYEIEKRGFVRAGYAADLLLVDLDHTWQVGPENILYKCGWSPLEGTTFRTKVTHTFVNGHLAYANGRFDESVKGQPLVKRSATG